MGCGAPSTSRVEPARARRRSSVLAAVVVMCGSCTAQDTDIRHFARRLHTGFELTKVFSESEERPLVSTGFLPDGRILAATKNGVVRVLVESATPNSYDEAVYLSLEGIIDNGKERGLLTLTVDPEFTTTGHIYIFWSPDIQGHRNFRLSRFTHTERQGLLSSRALLNSEVVLWEATGGYSSCCHYGGGIVITPVETPGDLTSRSIFLFTGDVFQGAAASQNLTSSWGKVHRLNMDGTPPMFNLGMEDGVGGHMLDTVYAIGVRNPYRATWNPIDSTILFADVGGNDQSLSWEEVNLLRPDANYGWPVCEGACNNPDFPACSCFAHDSPVISYAHGKQHGGKATSSVIGGLIYTGNQFPSELHGKYIFGDYVHRKIYVADVGFDPGRFDSLPDELVLDGTPGPIIDVTMGPDGLVWLSTLNGQLYHIRNVAGNRRPVITNCAVSVESGPPPLGVTFDGSSQDPDQTSVTTAMWNFGDGTDALVANTGLHVYTRVGVYTASYLVFDEFGASARCSKTIQVGWLPQAIIASPSDTALFRAGDVLQIAATEMANISTYTWSLDVIHNEHRHPVFSNVLGPRTTFRIEDHGHSYSDQVHVELRLEVESLEGLVSSITRTVSPDKRNITVSATIPEVRVSVDGIPYANGTSIDTLVAFKHSVNVPTETCDGQGRMHIFQRWSTGETDPRFTLQVPTEDSDLIAIFAEDGYCFVRTTGLNMDVDLTPIVRLNAGASHVYIDHDGLSWYPDADYVIGRSRTLSSESLPTDTVAFSTQSTFPEVFYTERYVKPRDGDGNLKYIVAVPVAGVYRVRLHFVDMYYDEAGQRVFDIEAQGVKAFDFFDIAGTGGYRHAVTVVMDVVVGAGEDLRLTLRRGAVENPTLSGLEVHGVDLTTPPTSAAPTTAAPTSGSPTHVPSASPSSVAPTSVAPTTPFPTTAVPSTGSPTTSAPTTSAPTTSAPSTAQPTTASPTSTSPTSTSPTSTSPTSLPPTSTAAPESTTEATALTSADCAVAQCGRDCALLPGCGWSSGKMQCRLGGKTAASEMDKCVASSSTAAAVVVVYNPDGTADCSAATCGLECAMFPGCGWSTGKMDCRKNAHTTATELTLGTCGGQTTVSPVTATVAPGLCKLAVCGRDCAMLPGCGWSSGKNDCRAGARTTQAEMEVGLCGTTSSSPQTTGECQTTCAAVCATMPGCGWSKKKGECRAGARTTKSEMHLGIC